MTIDEIDTRILNLLQHDSKMKTSTISKKINVPTTTVHNRIKKLLQLGVIKNFSVNIDYEKIGKPILAYIFIVANYMKLKGMVHEEVRKKIVGFLHPEEMHLVTGQFDILLKMYFKNPNHISKAIEILRTKIDGVEKSYTMIVLPYPESKSAKFDDGF